MSGILKDNSLLYLEEKYITNKVEDDFTDDFIIYKQVKYYKSNKDSKINYKHKEICLGYSLESINNTHTIPEDFKIYKKETRYKKGYAYSYFILQRPIPKYLAKKYNLEKMTNKNEYYKDIKKQKTTKEETKIKLEREMIAYSKKRKKEKEYSR